MVFRKDSFVNNSVYIPGTLGSARVRVVFSLVLGKRHSLVWGIGFLDFSHADRANFKTAL